MMSPNPTNSLDENLILIKGGPHAGTIVPYDVGSNDTNLGWHFVEDLVELPGTVKNISTRFIEICGPAEYHGKFFVIKDDYNYIPADLYYSDIAAAEYPPSTDHDWDADRNGIYGERCEGELDSVNGFADIYVGRAPVETPEEADTFIDKVIRYEKFQDPDGSLLPTDFAVSVLLGSKNWIHKDESGQLDRSAEGKEDIRRSFLDFDPTRWIFTRRYQDYADVPPADQTADLGKASKEEILNAIRDGHNVVSLSSHGGYGGLCYLRTNDIDDVISPPSIFYGSACSTNRFDVPHGEAFSEWTILNAYGAAVAYVGSSRSSWMCDNPIELEFWEKMLDSARLGEMFNACKLIHLGWQSYSLNLLGDPAMRVWSDRPRQLKVTHPEEIGTGKQKFQVIVTSAGHPVQDALVCVTMEGTLFITANTNASGVAFLTVPAGSAGIMQITVSGKNLIPYLGSVTVKKEGCIIADCAVGLGQFDQESGGYPVIDDQELYNGKPTCKALDVCGIQAHAGYYLIGSGGKDFECNINKFPYLNLIMKAEKDTDTCLLLMLHDRKPAYMRRFVMVGKTPKGTHPGYFDDSKDCFIIKDDEQWHDYTYDLRKLKEDYPNAETIKIAQFYSSRYCNGASHAFHISKLVCEGGDTGTWSIKTVDSIEQPEHGGYISIALDCNDAPHVSYVDARHLKYAKWTGDKWSIEIVDRVSYDYWETSIAVDSNGYPHISYIDVDEGDLKYAKWTGNKWSIEIVDSGGFGGNISLALDSNGYPHISYCGNRNRMYAKWTGTAWSVKTVDSGSVCAYTSIALDSNGYPHISYYDFKNHNLKYAKWTGNKWSIEIVDSVEVISEYGGSTSIALDSDGYPHISYHDDANHNTKYAKWTGTAWSIETIYHTGYIGMYI
jgi:hypothetical protein